MYCKTVIKFAQPPDPEQLRERIVATSGLRDVEINLVSTEYRCYEPIHPYFSARNFWITWIDDKIEIGRLWDDPWYLVDITVGCLLEMGGRIVLPFHGEPKEKGTTKKWDEVKDQYSLDSPLDFFDLPCRSEMTIRNVHILVKYAQGSVIVKTHYNGLDHFKPEDRRVFLLQITELIGHFSIDRSLADLAIKKSRLNDNNPACAILREGYDEAHLKRIVDLSTGDLESVFKLLLTLFSAGYQDSYSTHKNEPDKFWYWDYSQKENILKYMDLNEDLYLPLHEILQP